MSFKTAFVTVVCLFASAQIQAEYVQYNFTNDMDGLVSHRGKWEWSDRASLAWRLPDGGDGFAVHYKVGEGDELYEPVVDISQGLEYEIKYFIASEYDRSTTLQVQQLSLEGQLIEIVADYYVNAYPYNEEWFIATGKLEASNIPSRFGVFCQTNGENTQGDYLYGCALDYMKLNVYDPPTTPKSTTTTEKTTTTTPTTTTTTPTTTTTTTTPTTTTTTPTTTTTTTTPTTTTTTPTTTTTTTTPTTTTTTPTTTTTTPTTTTTTTTPTTTTTTPTTTTTTTPTTTTTTTTEPTTTEAPDNSIDFDFSNGTCGWTLGRSNGASWKRVIPQFVAYDGGHVLQVFPEDSYSGTVLAMSPRLMVGPYGTVNITIEFYLEGTSVFPSYLRVRRRISYVECDENPVLNLDVYGNGDSPRWLVASGSFSDLSPGEEFSIVVEGNLGIANDDNIVAVSRVFVDGVIESSYSEDYFFDLSNGLVGWQSGSMDGGNWNVVDYSSLDASIGMPQPSSENILMLDRFNIHSGVVTIESPPIRTNTTHDTVNLSYWLKASDKNPVSFRMNCKTIDGVYDKYPFFNFNADDLYNGNNWKTFSTPIRIPSNTAEDYFQIVIEADLGGDADNMFVIDRITLT